MTQQDIDGAIEKLETIKLMLDKLSARLWSEQKFVKASFVYFMRVDLLRDELLELKERI